MGIAESIGYLLGSFVTSLLFISTIFYFIKGRTIPFAQVTQSRGLIIASLIFSFLSYSNYSNKELQSQLSSHTYPEQAVVKFVQGCKKGVEKSNSGNTVAEKTCSCLITEAQKKYTYGEFTNILKEMTNEAVSPSEFTKAKMTELASMCQQGKS
jgi:hypothetical protein